MINMSKEIIDVFYKKQCEQAKSKGVGNPDGFFYFVKEEIENEISMSMKYVKKEDMYSLIDGYEFIEDDNWLIIQKIF